MANKVRITDMGLAECSRGSRIILIGALRFCCMGDTYKFIIYPLYAQLAEIEHKACSSKIVGTSLNITASNISIYGFWLMYDDSGEYTSHLL